MHLPFHNWHWVLLFSTENAAEKELWRENTDHEDPGEFILIYLACIHKRLKYVGFL